MRRIEETMWTMWTIASRGSNHSTLAGLVLACSLLLPACSDENGIGSGTATTAAPDRTAESAKEGSRARQLAMTEVTGSTPVDVQLRSAQELCKQLPEIRDHWIALGRLWVRKAREAADPGYYLSAKACAEISVEIEPGNRPGANLVALA